MSNYNSLFNDVYNKLIRKKLKYFIQNVPLFRIQLGYYFHLLKNKYINKNKIETSTTCNKISFNYRSLIKLLKLKFKLLKLRKSSFKCLNNNTMLFGFQEHYNMQNGDISNPFLSPIKAELFVSKIPFYEFLITNNGSVKNNQTDIYKLYQIILNYNTLLFLFKNKLNKKEKYFKENSESIVKEFQFSESIYSENISNIIFKIQIDHEIKYNTFIHLLKITKPKVIWTYCYYDNTVMALIRAANKLGIKNIEYQHSVQSDEHFAYAKWPNIDYNKMHFPNIFWVWSKSDADRIVKNFSGITYKPTVVVGGNLAVIQEKNKGLKSELGTETGILVSLQGLWIPDFVEKIIEKDILHKWYFRLHPRYPQDKQRLIDFKNKFPDKVEIDLANNLSLFSLFTKVKANIVDFSGVALEAEQFGIKNIIVNDKGASVFQEKIKSGDYLYVNSEEALEVVLQDYDFDLYHKSQPTNDKKELEELINKVFLS